VSSFGENLVLKTIMVAVDGSDHTRAVIHAAVEWARLCDAALHVLCVVDPAYYLDEPDGLRPSAVDEMDYPAPAIEREGADALVRRAVAELQLKGIAAEGSVVPGEPVKCIVEAAAVLRADLIMVGHRHHSWFGRLADPSVCHDVLERAHRPVLVIPIERASTAAG
jgi:nucleotide-binding universal stress UspA family protein